MELREDWHLRKKFFYDINTCDVLESKLWIRSRKFFTFEVSFRVRKFFQTFTSTLMRLEIDLLKRHIQLPFNLIIQVVNFTGICLTSRRWECGRWFKNFGSALFCDSSDSILKWEFILKITSTGTRDHFNITWLDWDVNKEGLGGAGGQTSAFPPVYST